MSKKETQKNSLRQSFAAPLTAEEKEAQLEKLMAKSAAQAPPPPARKNIDEPEPTDEAQREKHRVTLDLSKTLARKVKLEAAGRDLTLKGFIVELLNRYFDEKERK